MKVKRWFTGTNQRVWMDIETTFIADDDESMLEVAIRGHNTSTAVEDYDEVLIYKILPIELRHLPSQQRESFSTDVLNNSTLEDFK